MANIGELVERLVEQGIPIGEASEIIALAVAAGAATFPHRKSAGAVRQKAYRDRMASVTKRNEGVTALQEPERNESVTNRNESVTRDACSLSKSIKIDRKRERATQLPEGWRPSDTAWQAAVERVGQQRAEIELVKFRNHAADKGRTSKRWDAAWGNWIGRAIEYGAVSPQAVPTAAGEKIDLEEAVKMYAKNGRWSRWAPCPEPGQTGCTVPPEMFAKYGLLSDGRKAA